jgi:hypothetical protein
MWTIDQITEEKEEEEDTSDGSRTPKEKICYIGMQKKEDHATGCLERHSVCPKKRDMTNANRTKATPKAIRKSTEKVMGEQNRHQKFTSKSFTTEAN